MATAAGVATSCDLDRPTKSPSPLSGWNRVFPDPNTPPDAIRNTFTILAHDQEEYSPRPPKPEFIDLEAKGMVSLSSPQWTPDTHVERISKTSQQNGKQKKQQHTVSFCLNHGKRDPSPTTEKDDVGNYDDGLVIVTDKFTQTDQPWPYKRQSSLEDMRGIGHESLQSPSSNTNTGSTNNTNNHDNNDNIDNNSNTQGDVDDNNSNNIEIVNHYKSNVAENDHHNDPIADDGAYDEAPTLKVEYVGKIWDAYINDFLLASDHISEAAIYDRVTQSCIACSLQYAMSPEEFNYLLASLNNLSVAYRCGVKINGRFFKTILADGRRGLMAKGEEHDGCSACQTRTLVIVAIHDRRGKGRRCNEELMRLGDFFWAKGL